MKLITDDGKEFNLDDVKPFVIEGNKKVIIIIKDCYNVDANLVELLDNFFGKGKWLLSVGSMGIEIKDE